jgi:CubicO group peptidase (beta-lactamase class C family)
MTNIDEALDPAIRSHLGNWPGQVAAGVVDRTGNTLIVGDLVTTFAWASVTKLLVALAMLVAVEEGVVGLEQPAGPSGSTLAHLLAHASGLPFEGCRPLAPPGRRRIYSNTGIEAAAAHLAAFSRMSFADYLRDGVLGPLDMRTTVFEGSPAYGASGTLRDLLKLGQEFLRPSIVSGSSWQQATDVAWPGLSGVLPGFGRQDPCDWGLGPEIRARKFPHWTGSLNSPSTYGHFGQAGSFLWVDPRAGLALAASSTAQFGTWAKEAWPALADEVLAAWARGTAEPGKP